MTTGLLLKLVLVPMFLAAIAAAGARFGPRGAGIFAGLPVAGGPILFLLALEQGLVFGAEAAAAAMRALAGTVVFAAVYSWTARRFGAAVSVTAAFTAWFAAVAAGVALDPAVTGSFLIGLAAVVAGPWLLPRVGTLPALTGSAWTGLPLRMLAGVVLTLAATGVATRVGPDWSGVAGLFPVISIVLAVSTHRRHGPDVAITLLRGLSAGLASILAFLLVLALILPEAGLAAGFGAASLAALLAQGLIVAGEARRRRR